LAKKVLRIEYDFNFTLVGISSPVKEYRLCWFLNKELNIEFTRQEDLEIYIDKDNSGFFSFYQYSLENLETEYFYMNNRGTSGFLIPENKETDYFFMVNQRLSKSWEKELITQLNKIEVIQAAYLINPESLKSRENLLFI
jgi:hypothetical protein